MSRERERERRAREWEGSRGRKKASLIQGGWEGCCCCPCRGSTASVVVLHVAGWLCERTGRIGCCCFLPGTSHDSTSWSPLAHWLFTQQLHRDVTLPTAGTAEVRGKEDFLCDYFCWPPSPIYLLLSFFHVSCCFCFFFLFVISVSSDLSLLVLPVLHFSWTFSAHFPCCFLMLLDVASFYGHIFFFASLKYPNVS